VWVATADYAPFTFDANVGFTRLPAGANVRSHLHHYSAAANYAPNEHLIFVLDAALDTNPDSRVSIHQELVIVGVILTLRPGMDVDAGYGIGFGSVSGVRQWLFGFTYRGAP
jgi:hypothetical protein